MIRLAKRQDLPACRELFRRSVREIGARAYPEDQVSVWSAFADSGDFRDFVLGTTTLVKDTGGEILGFAGADQRGHICSLFVDPAHERKGIGSELMAALLARFSHLPELTTMASDFSRPLFERFGFRALEEETTQYQGVNIIRYRMRRTNGESR
jgi:putative acetyltransferase